MARNSATIDIGINVPAAEMRKAEQQLQSLFNKTQSFNKNPIVAKNFTQPLGRITGAANEFNKSLEASNARVIAFGASAGAIFAVQKAMSELVRTTIKVEQQLTNIRVLLDATGKQFERFSDGLYKAAKATGNSFYEVAESAEEFARQGLNVEQSLKRTTAAMTLAKLGGMDAKNATESLTAAMNTFGAAAGSATNIVNKLAQVDAKFAVSSGDLAEAIKRTGAAAVSANVSFEELISIVTAAQEKTARGGAVIGNSFKTIFTRIQRPETLKQLNALGVAVKDANKEVLPAIQILKNYAKVYDTLGSSTKATSAEMLAGVFQVNILKAVLPDLANNVGRYDRALKVANKTTNEATERMAILTSTTEGTLNKTMVNLTQFASEVGDLTIKPAIDRILKMLNGFADLISPKNFFGLGETIGTAVYEGMGKIISGPGLTLLGFVLVKIGAKLAVFVKDAAAGFMGMETASQKLASTQTVIQNILANRPELINQAVASEEGMVAVARVLAQKLKESSMEMERLTLAAQKAAPAVLAMQGGAKSRGGARRSRAGGFVPSFNMAASGFVPNYNQEVQERRLAAAGGYQAGKIKEATIPGVGKVTYNGNEEIKKFPGLQQPGIMPPPTSAAGNNYRDSFRGVHGYDPYNSAGGFVPNFAGQSKLGLGKTLHYQFLNDTEKKAYNTAQGAGKRGFWGKLSPARQAELRKKGGGGTSGSAERALKEERDAAKDPSTQHSWNADNRIGMVAFAGAKNMNASVDMPVNKLSALKDLRARFPELNNDSIRFDNIAVGTAEGLNDKAGLADEFFKNIGKSMAGPVTSAADSFITSVMGEEQGLSPESKKGLRDAIKKKGSFLNPGTEGDIFEAAIRLVTTDASKLGQAFDGNKNFQSPFDFEEGIGAGATQKLKDVFFGGSKKIYKADAKKTASRDTLQTLIKKTYNQAVADKSLKAGLPGLSTTMVAGEGHGGKLDADERKAAAARVGTAAKAKRDAKAGGFIPNFALGGLGAAINREDRAGVRRDQVRVGHDDRLRGGVGVYNTKEGSLGNAIDMHLASGETMKSIQRQGAGLGFVPNFAKSAEPGEGSMAMQMGMMMVGSQLSVMSGRMEEANEGTATFASSLMNLSGQTMMYLPMLTMATQSSGGLAAIFGKLNKSILSGVTAMTALNASSARASGSLSTLSMGGLGSMLGGKKIGGVSNWARGKEAFSKGKHRALNPSTAARAAGAKPAGWFGATARGVAGASGSLSAGGGAVGALASPLGIAAAIAAAGYLAHKLYKSSANKEVDRLGKAGDEHAERAEDAFTGLNEMLKKVSISTEAYTKALQKGDAAAAEAAKKKIIYDIAAGGSDMDTLLKGRPVEAGGKKYSSSSGVIEGIRSGNISGAEIPELMHGVEALGTRSAELSKKVKGVDDFLDTFVDKQRFFWSTDMGAGAISQAANGMVSQMDDYTLPQLDKMFRAAGDLSSAYNTNATTTTTSGNESRRVTSALGKFLKTIPHTTQAQKDLHARFAALGTVSDMDEAALMKVVAALMGKYLPAINNQIKGIKESKKTTKKVDKALINLYKDARILANNMDALSADLAFAAKISKVMHDGATAMFEVGTKTLSHELSQTASKLTNIEFKNMEDLKKLQIKQARTQGENFEAIQKSMADEMKNRIGKDAAGAKTGTDELMGLHAKDFQAVIQKGLVPALNKAIAGGDIKGAKDAIEQAILKAGSGASGKLVISDTAKEKLQNFSDALGKLAISTNRKERLDRMQMTQQEKLIAAQRVAALAQLKLAQKIEFAGGVAGASGAPQAAIERVLNNQLGGKRGRAMGDNDMETKHLIDQIKVLKTLTLPGGPNPASGQRDALADQFVGNLNKFLKKFQMSDAFSEGDIRNIAEAQADNLIRPDRSLEDIHEQLTALHTSSEKNLYAAKGGLRVHIDNVSELSKELDKTEEEKKRREDFKGLKEFGVIVEKDPFRLRPEKQPTVRLGPNVPPPAPTAAQAFKGFLGNAALPMNFKDHVVGSDLLSPEEILQGQDAAANITSQGARRKLINAKGPSTAEDVQLAKDKVWLAEQKLKGSVFNLDKRIDDSAWRDQKSWAGLSEEDRKYQPKKAGRVKDPANVASAARFQRLVDAGLIHGKTGQAAIGQPPAGTFKEDRNWWGSKSTVDRAMPFDPNADHDQRGRSYTAGGGEMYASRGTAGLARIEELLKQEKEDDFRQNPKKIATLTELRKLILNENVDLSNQIDYANQNLKDMQERNTSVEGLDASIKASQDLLDKLTSTARGKSLDRGRDVAGAYQKLGDPIEAAKKAGVDVQFLNGVLKPLEGLIAKSLGDKEIDKSEVKALENAFQTATAAITGETERFKLAAGLGNKLGLGNDDAISPIQAALEQFQNTFSNGDIIQSFTSIEAAAASMLDTNKDWATSLEMAQAGLEKIDVEMQDGIIFTGTAAEKMLYMNTAVAKLQSTISIEKWQGGITGVAAARDAILKTLELLRTTGGSTQDIEDQLKLLKQLEDGRIREAKAIEKGLSGQQFLEASTTTLIEFSKKISDLGGKGKVPVDVLQNLEMIREAMAKNLINVSEAEKLWNEQLVDTGLQLDKVRMIAGLIKPEEYRTNLTKGFGELYGEAYKSGEGTIRAALLGITEGTEGRKDLNKEGKDELFRKFGGSVYDAIANSSNSARQAQQAAMLEYVKSGGSFGEATKKLIDLEEQRRDIYGQLAAKAITANQAEVMLAKTRASTSADTLNQQLANGTIAQADYEAGMRALAKTMLEGDVSSKEFGKSLKFTLQALTGLEKNAAQKDFIQMVDRNANAFKQGVKDSFEAAINGTMTFRQAMAKVMQDIASDMLKNSISTFVDHAFAAVGNAVIPQSGAPGAATGGHVVGGARGIQHFQSGGLVTGGKGGIDDIPARLGRGEYVIKESSARRYGTDYLNDLNAGRVNKFAAGGSVDSAHTGNLQNTYDWNDPKKPTAGSFNVDSRLSALGQMDSSNPQNAYKFSKEATLDQYLKEKAADDEMKKNAMMAYKTQRRKIIQGAVTQIATVVGSAALSGAMSGAGEGTGAAGGGGVEGPAGHTTTAGFGEAGFTGGPQMSYSPGNAPVGMQGGYTHTGGMSGGRTPANIAQAQQMSGRHGKEQQDFAMMQFKQQQLTQKLTPKTFWQRFVDRMSGSGGNVGRDKDSDATNQTGYVESWGADTAGPIRNRQRSTRPGYIPSKREMKKLQIRFDKNLGQSDIYQEDHSRIRRANGGPAHTRGRDTVPAMLTAGEWVVPKETVDLYGLGFMNKLNKGNVQHFAEGGYVGPRGGGETPSSGGGSASSVNNDFTINVNVTNEGGGSDDGRTALGEKDQNTQGGLEENERNKELGVRIKGAVVQEIVLQKRPGGLLYNEKRS